MSQYEMDARPQTDNVAAVRLYDRLGFVVTRTDCLYAATIT